MGKVVELALVLLGGALEAGGFIGLFVFWIQILIIAFKKSIGWGLVAWLLGPFATIGFIAQNWEVCRTPVKHLLLSLAALTVGVGMVIGAFFLDKQSRMASARLESPTLTARPSSPVIVGGTITDTAMIASGANPTGFLTYSLFRADAGDCDGPPLFTSFKSVSGDGRYTSQLYGPLAPGTYKWLVTYSGDEKNNPASVPCGQLVTVR
ncbi:MAG TPA: hypothetical protein VHR45_20755 [Thermoanaerobaculia bacterium]|nr:hypothetical protein [Thermoanaerobaculia bacterium]